MSQSVISIDGIMESVIDNGYLTEYDVWELVSTLECSDSKYQLIKSLIQEKLPPMLDYRNERQEKHLQKLSDICDRISISDNFSEQFVQIINSINYSFGSKQKYNYDESVKTIPLEWGLYLAGCFTSEDLTNIVLSCGKEVDDLARELVNSHKESVSNLSETHSNTEFSSPSTDKISELYNKLCEESKIGGLKKFCHKLKLLDLRDLMYTTDMILYEECHIKDYIIRGYILAYYNLIYDILDNIIQEPDQKIQINLISELTNKQDSINQLYPCKLSTSVCMLMELILVVLAERTCCNSTDMTTSLPIVTKIINRIGSENNGYENTKNDVLSTLFMIAESFKRLNCNKTISLEQHHMMNDGGFNHYDFHAQSVTKLNTSSSLEDVMDGSRCLMRVLTETFEVLRDGTIKVTLKGKTTYMNEYAVNHRLLKYNAEHGNYEDMKYNLVYCMILIENIEKNVLYNKKIDRDSELYKDAEKARGFAKNDIKTYLPIVMQNDRKFSINEFYRKVKADKATITINGVETASGIKKILKSILYS